MHFQFNLAEYARFFHHLNHAVVFFKVKGRDFHGQHVLSVFAAELHVPVMPEIFGRDDDSVYFRMADQHLFR